MRLRGDDLPGWQLAFILNKLRNHIQVEKISVLVFANMGDKPLPRRDTACGVGRFPPDSHNKRVSIIFHSQCLNQGRGTRVPIVSVAATGVTNVSQASQGWQVSVSEVFWLANG